ncbi:MAG: hypothetical protein KDA63_16550 [Planctomycetales bacterium]|nr:hypothetical protein [Planctomycetales bacterium]
MVEHVVLPRHWRFVLLRLCHTAGRHGASEESAFERLPAVPPRVTERLHEIVREQMLPAARAGETDRFGEAVFEYGVLAGECFATQQSGAFADSRVAELVRRIRGMGIRGVGQSSWGPTVFALAGATDEAERIVTKLRETYARDELDAIVTSPSQWGAHVNFDVESG